MLFYCVHGIDEGHDVGRGNLEDVEPVAYESACACEREEMLPRRCVNEPGERLRREHACVRGRLAQERSGPIVALAGIAVYGMDEDVRIEPRSGPSTVIEIVSRVLQSAERCPSSNCAIIRSQAAAHSGSVVLSDLWGTNLAMGRPRRVSRTPSPCSTSRIEPENSWLRGHERYGSHGARHRPTKFLSG